MAAGCVLPLTQKENLDTQLGTRHRAAIGMSEQGDAMIVVTSEETGTISIACKGQLTRNLTDSDLREHLIRYLCDTDNEEKPPSKAYASCSEVLKNEKEKDKPQKSHI